MKSLIQIVQESNDWNPQFKHHKDSFNSFIKWYDKQLKYMNKDELLDMLKYIMTEIADDSLVEIK